MGLLICFVICSTTVWLYSGCTHYIFPYYFSQYLRLTPYELMQTSDLKLRVHSLPAAGVARSQLPTNALTYDTAECW
jgi:hypothetical protein